MFNSLSLDGVSLLMIQQRDNCDTCGDKDLVSQHTSWAALCRAGSRVFSSPGMRRPSLNALHRGEDAQHLGSCLGHAGILACQPLHAEARQAVRQRWTCPLQQAYQNQSI